ncbi:MAG: nicB 1 [Hyphomicrobiales bacterium]|nr:nicB 1 [Hyphomicrobiales bacterium]
MAEASYVWPFQSYASMGPGCAVLDYQPNRITTLWTGTQKPHYARDGVAAILGVSPEKAL